MPGQGDRDKDLGRNLQGPTSGILQVLSCIVLCSIGLIGVIYRYLDQGAGLVLFTLLVGKSFRAARAPT